MLARFLGKTPHMKIAYVITHLEPVGGAQIHLLDLACSLRDSGNEVCIFAGGDVCGHDMARARGLQVCPLRWLTRPINPYSDIRALSELRRCIRNYGPDLVHAHSSKAGILARYAAFFEGLPSIFTAHGWAFTEGVGRLRYWIALLMEKMVAQISSRIITVSSYDRSLALTHKIGSEEKVVCIHNGIPDVDASLHSTPSLSPPRIVMVARFQEPKRPELLIEALSRLKHKAWVAEIVGDGPSWQSAHEKVVSLGLEDRILLPGYRSDVAAVLSKAQIFVLLSCWEGLPLSVLEAMRAGLPVIASDVGGISEMIGEEEAGYLIADNNMDLLCEKLACLLNNPDLRERYGAAAREKYRKSFSFDDMIKATCSLYDDLLSKADQVR